MLTLSYTSIDSCCLGSCSDHVLPIQTYGNCLLSINSTCFQLGLHITLCNSYLSVIIWCRLRIARKGLQLFGMHFLNF